MFIDIKCKDDLTLGELREYVNNVFSKLHDDTPIKMCIDLYQNNVQDNQEQPCAPVYSIIADAESINFYNYI